ncbi:MAG: PepSY domain-containing protein [Chloroflexi bacterium OHK40]
MTQRMMLITAAALTAFILVVAGALAGRLTSKAPMAIAPDQPSSATDMSSATSFAEREAAYQTAIAEANRRLEQANQQLAQQRSAATPSALSDAVISAAQAQTIALQTAPGATLLRPAELVRYQGVLAYEVVLDQGTRYIDAERATLLASETRSDQISAAQAVEAARAYRGGGEVREVEQEREHGALVYEVKFADGGKVYIDAASGQVVYAQLGSSEHRTDETEGNHDDEDE